MSLFCLIKDQYKFLLNISTATLYSFYYGCFKADREITVTSNFPAYSFVDYEVLWVVDALVVMIKNKLRTKLRIMNFCMAKGLEVR